MNTGSAYNHKVHLDEGLMRVGRCCVSYRHSLEDGFKALRVISRDQHGIKISRTHELLAIGQGSTDHRSLAFKSTNKGRQVSRFISFVGDTTSGDRWPFRLIFVIAILASWRPTSEASTRTLVSAGIRDCAC